MKDQSIKGPSSAFESGMAIERRGCSPIVGSTSGAGRDTHLV